MQENRSFYVRFATVADASTLAHLHVETFNETHGNSPPLQVREQQWKSILSQHNDQEFVLLIADSDEQLAGFARGRPYDNREHASIKGEVNKIYLLRKYHKKGLGRRLLCAVATEFVKRGVHSMLLFGDARNPSNGFYEHLGAERLLAANGEFHGGYAWKNLNELIAQCNNQ